MNTNVLYNLFDTLRWPLFFVALLLSPLVQAQLAVGQEQFREERYEEALFFLEKADNIEARRLLGLTHYHLQQYAKARPLLEATLEKDPADREVRRALIGILLDSGETERASILLQTDEAADAELLYLAGRLEAARGNHTAAIERMQQAIEADETLLPRLARELARLLLLEGKPAQARAILIRAGQTSEGFEARCLERHFPGIEHSIPRSWSVNAAYQLQHDSNVVLLPDVIQPSGKSDIRHVLTADGSIRHALDKQWSLIGEGHLYQSLHQDLDQFDETRLTALASLGWSTPRYGIRLPLEVSTTSVDGDHLLRSTRFAPGGYLRSSDGLTMYVYALTGENDYSLEVFDPNEQRSGDYKGWGSVFIFSFPRHRGELRMLFENVNHDTEGSNWMRDENRLYLHGRFPVTDRVNVAGAVEQRNLDFDNLNSVYLVRRDDNVLTWSLNASYAISKQLQLQAAYSMVDADSNIEVYTYDRKVYSVGVSWRF